MSNSASDHDDGPSPLRSASSTGRLRLRIGQLAEALTVLAGLPTLGACGAAYGWPLELLSHFRVQYALTLLTLGIVLVVVRRIGWACAAIALFAVNAWYVAPYVLPFGGVAEFAEVARLKLVTVNVFSGNPTPDRVIEFLRSTDPDVIVVLEVTPEWARRLEELSSAHPHSAVQSSTGNFGIALYSRLPLEEFEFVPLSVSNHAIAARVRIDGQEVNVVGAHPFPPMGPRGTRLRNQQLDQLAKHVTTLRGPTIVAGDLNITPFSPFFDEFLTSAKLHDPRRGQGLFTTWPANRLPLRIPIDHVLVSDGLTAELATGPDVGSDHLPVVAEIQLPLTDSAR